MSVKKASEKADLRFRGKISLLFKNNTGWFLRFILTGLFIGLGVWFFNHEKTEISSVGKLIFSVDPLWFSAGLVIFIMYIFLQGWMYVMSFASVGIKVSLADAIILFLKRNFISVFIPAGGVSSMAFFGDTIENKGIPRSKIYFASAIYAFIGILSVILVAIPAFLFAITGSDTGQARWYALAGAVLLIILVYILYRSVIEKKLAYRIILKIYPAAEMFIEEVNSSRVITRFFIYTVITSIFIEFAGIAHVYVSMGALNLEPSFATSVLAYIIVVLFLIISPFLRGLGAIEVSMSYLLLHSGYSDVESVSITLLFRFFEFWLPLFAGIISFLIRVEKLIRRIFPSLLIFSLGIVNIISVLSPGAPEKLKLLQDFLFLDAVNFSNGFVLLTGLFLLVTATFMLRGLRSSWWFAFILSFLSVAGHLTKGINYTEASLALLVVIVLLTTRKDYYVRTNPRIRRLGLLAASLGIATVFVYGVTGFYFLDRKHFQIDFNLWQSVKYTFQNLLLFGNGEILPKDSFGKDFLYTIRISGISAMVFLVYSLIRPYFFRPEPSAGEKEEASEILKRHGRSSLDYFKLYYDKQIFILREYNSFISYKIHGNFAVVLDDPVTPGKDEMKMIIREFSSFCYDNGLKEIYYRIPSESLPFYIEAGKKSLFIGQEGTIDLNTFSLEGGSMKSVRNALNKIKDQGYISRIYNPPLKQGLVQKLKSVSDDWLRSMNREELVFSQGMFLEDEIRQQTVITVENSEEKILAFLNVIPDYKPEEGTYDLLRKTHDAPNGIMDYILIELFSYFRSQSVRYVNLGLAPLSGLNDPHKFTEKTMKFAYEKIRSFSHYRGQKEYKDKFGPVWSDRFLIYDNDYDLISIPAVLAKVIKS